MIWLIFHRKSKKLDVDLNFFSVDTPAKLCPFFWWCSRNVVWKKNRNDSRWHTLSRWIVQPSTVFQMRTTWRQLWFQTKNAWLTCTDSAQEVHPMPTAGRHRDSRLTDVTQHALPTGASLHPSAVASGDFRLQEGQLDGFQMLRHEIWQRLRCLMFVTFLVLYLTMWKQETTHCHRGFNMAPHRGAGNDVKSPFKEFFQIGPSVQDMSKVVWYVFGCKA